MPCATLHDIEALRTRLSAALRAAADPESRSHEVIWTSDATARRTVGELLAGSGLRAVVVTDKRGLLEWHDYFGGDCRVVAGAESQRRGFYAWPNLFVATLQQALRRAALFAQAWDVVLLDRAEALRDASSKTCKALRRFCCRARWALTSSPMQNASEDVDAIKAFCGSFLDTRSFLESSVARVALRDGGSDEPFTVRVHGVTLSAAERAAYEACCREVYTRKSLMAENELRKCCSHPALYLRSVYAGLASGALPALSGDAADLLRADLSRWSARTSAKHAAVAELLHGSKGCLVALTAWRGEADLLSRALVKCGFEVHDDAEVFFSFFSRQQREEEVPDSASRVLVMAQGDAIQESALLRFVESGGGAGMPLVIAITSIHWNLFASPFLTRAVQGSFSGGSFSGISSGLSLYVFAGRDTVDEAVLRVQLSKLGEWRGTLVGDEETQALSTYESAVKEYLSTL